MTTLVELEVETATGIVIAQVTSNVETTTAEMILQMKEEVGRPTPIVVMVIYIDNFRTILLFKLLVHENVSKL